MFKENTGFTENEIENIKRITAGYSNYIYRVKTIYGKEYKVRIADNSKFISRNNEANIYKNLGYSGFLYFDLKTGNSIQDWIIGRPSKKKDIDHYYLLSLFRIIDEIHNVKLDCNFPVLVHNDMEFYENTFRFMDEYDANKYKELVLRNKNDDRTLCHNDISFGNLIFNPLTKELNLIDYEWGRINSKYWDYGNFIKETDLSIDKIKYLSQIASLNLKKLYEYIYISTIYSIQLSMQFSDDLKIRNYRNKLFKQLDRYRDLIS